MYTGLSQTSRRGEELYGQRLIQRLTVVVVRSTCSISQSSRRVEHDVFVLGWNNGDTGTRA
jgi:hypothetical protein